MSGILPYLQQLHPDLRGAALVTQAADGLGVHYTTVYKWLRSGMASAEAQYLLRLADALKSRDIPVDFDDLRRMCQLASDTPAEAVETTPSTEAP